MLLHGHQHSIRSCQKILKEFEIANMDNNSKRNRKYGHTSGVRLSRSKSPIQGDPENIFVRANASLGLKDPTKRFARKEEKERAQMEQQRRLSYKPPPVRSHIDHH
jgi:hypothetical protein